MFIDAGGLNPLWVGSFPGQVVFGCIINLAKEWRDDSMVKRTCFSEDWNLVPNTQVRRLKTDSKSRPRGPPLVSEGTCIHMDTHTHIHTYIHK